jgi:feruloyl-CoA synthase
LRGRGFPNIAACRAQACLPDSASVAEVLNSREVRAAIAQGLARLRALRALLSRRAALVQRLADPMTAERIVL